MTAMLASVSSLAEARAVIDCADVVDLKDPRAGALGALPIERVRKIVDWIGGRRRVSATLGDLPMEAEAIARAVVGMAGTGVDFIKIGLFDANRSPACLRAAGARARGRGIRLVAVLFADRMPDFALLREIATAGFAGAMLDTADKRGGTLVDWLPAPTLQEFVTRAHALGLFTGLAGSLREDHLPAVLDCGPDFIGLRGALCEGAERTHRISRRRARAMAARIRRGEPPAFPFAKMRVLPRAAAMAFSRDDEGVSP